MKTVSKCVENSGTVILHTNKKVNSKYKNIWVKNRISK